MTTPRPASLGSKQRQHLKGLGHHLRPVVQVGHQGFTEGVLAALDEALDLHELVKIKVGQNAPDPDEEDPIEALVARLGCHHIQSAGRVVLLFRQQADPERRRVTLPK